MFGNLKLMAFQLNFGICLSLHMTLLSLLDKNIGIFPHTSTWEIPQNITALTKGNPIMREITKAC